VKTIWSGLLQVGHLPSKRQTIGLPPPPISPLRKPYTFKSPTVVKTAPTAASGSQSGILVIVLGPTARQAGTMTFDCQQACNPGLAWSTFVRRLSTGYLVARAQQIGPFVILRSWGLLTAQALRCGI